MQDSMGIFRRFIEEQLGVSKDSSSGEIINAIKRLVRLSSYYPVEIILEIKHRFEEMSQAALQREQKAREEEQHAHEAHIDEVTSMELPLDWENVFAGDERAQGKHFEHIPDALVSSLTTLGRVDIEYIASVTGQDCKAVILALKGAIYQNPETWEECFYKGWELSDEYLSGNIMRKWKIAKSANKTYRGYFDDNLKALESVLPPAVVAEDIYITLGSPWVPADVIDDFIAELFGKNAICRTGNYETIHDEITGTWEIPEKGRYCHSARVTNTYGTERIEALYILERTLNLKAVSVTDEVSSPNAKSGKKRVINEEETAAALENSKSSSADFRNGYGQTRTVKNDLSRFLKSDTVLCSAGYLTVPSSNFPGCRRMCSSIPIRRTPPHESFSRRIRCWRMMSAPARPSL